MNFINPYTEVYIRSKALQLSDIPFYKEVIWSFLKHLNNRLNLFKHRVNINFVDSEQEIGVRRLASIYEYGIKVDSNFFFAKTEEEKRDLLLEIVYTAFHKLAEEYSWEVEPIKNAYQKTKADNNTFLYVSSGKTARDKRHSGAISLKLERNNLIVWCEIKDNLTNVYSKTKLLETDEHNLSWSREIKDYGWYDNTIFGLKFLAGDLWIAINIQSGDIEEIKNPRERNLEEIEAFLKKVKAPAYNTTYSA